MKKCVFLVLVACIGCSEAGGTVVFPDVTPKPSNGTRSLDPRFGFGVGPTGDGGVTGSFSSSSGSQSFSFQAGAQGFSASQSSSFNTHFPGHYRPSMSSSQSSSISAGPAGGAASSAASQAAVIGGVAMTNSQSAATSFNRPGFVRKRPAYNTRQPPTYHHRQPSSDLFVFST